MSSRIHLWFRLALVAVCTPAPSVKAQSVPSVTIVATDPALFGRLVNYEPLYVRLATHCERRHAELVPGRPCREAESGGALGFNAFCILG